MAKPRSILKLNLPKIPLNRDTNHIPSRDSGSGVGARKDTPVYTGGNIIGIGTLHKSNAIPIFSEQEAKDISAMRR
ncbi:hypothetical protein EB118_22715 [bacterium]|nr:hypothetical protein [bacterium]